MKSFVVSSRPSVFIGSVSLDSTNQGSNILHKINDLCANMYRLQTFFLSLCPKQYKITTSSLWIPRNNYNHLSWSKETHFQVCFFFFLVVVLGFELSVSHLPGRCSTPWAMAPALFAFSYFSGRVSGSPICQLASWTLILLFIPSMKLGWQVYTTTLRFLLVEMRSH
jgi:hypothetical protein